MYDNDQIGDCTCAAVGHMVQSWTQYAKGAQAVPANTDIVAAYSAITGYNGTPATDHGAALLNVLAYWKQNGIGGHKVDSFVAVDYQNLDEVRQAIADFGGVYIGVQLPITAQSQDIWDVTGGTGSPVPGSWGGHCIPLVGYDANYFYCVTWGTLKRLTPAWLSKYMFEGYAVITTDYLNSQGVDPQGFNLSQMLLHAEQMQEAAAGFFGTTYQPWLGAATINGNIAGTLIGKDIVLTYNPGLYITLSQNQFIVANGYYNVVNAIADSTIGYIAPGNPPQLTRSLVLCKLDRQTPANTGYFGVSSGAPNTTFNGIVTNFIQNDVAQSFKGVFNPPANTSSEFMYTTNTPLNTYYCAPVWTPNANNTSAQVQAFYIAQPNLAIAISKPIYNQIEYFTARLGRSLAIDRLYHGILNRTNMYSIDTAGWEYWSSEYARVAKPMINVVNGINQYPAPIDVFSGPGHYIIDTFLNASSFANLNLTDKTAVTNFATHMYTYGFGRAPDTDGLNYWVTSLLNKTITPANFVITFLTHPSCIDYQAIWSASA
jgi:hypothetical protein